MKKLFFFTPIIFLIFATTLTKNTTKKLDKEIFQLKENIRIMGEIHSTKEPKIGQNVTMKAFFDTRPHYLFTVENN